MKKKYLKTVEDVIALKDTDTKIYSDGFSDYYKFVNGTFCRFRDDGFWQICSSIDSGDKLYILEEEPMQEATEDDLGKLCWFWDFYEDKNHLGRLESFCKNVSYRYIELNGVFYKHCRRLSPDEVAEITGYKVEEKE